VESGTTAWGNLAQLSDCLRTGGEQCSLATGGGGAFGFAIVIVVALSIGGIILSYQGLALATDPVMERLVDRQWPNAILGATSGCLWCYLWLTYALPECRGHSVFTWMIISPLYTLLLMVGAIGTAAAVSFTAGTVVSRRHPWGLSGDRWAWALLTTATTGILIGWHFLYNATHFIAAGPYGRGPGWFQDALGVWTLHLPVTALWDLARTLATTPGVVMFAALAGLSVFLPRGTGRGTANLASIVMTTAIGELVGVVISTCVLIVVCLLVIAVAALAFMFFAAYLMAYALVLAFLGALIGGALRR